MRKANELSSFPVSDAGEKLAFSGLGELMQFLERKTVKDGRTDVFNNKTKPTSV